MDSPYFKRDTHQVISTKWPRGGYLIWNWTTHKWDSITEEELAAIKKAEANLSCLETQT